MFEGYDRKNIVKSWEIPLYHQYRYIRYFIEWVKKLDFSDFLEWLDSNCILKDIIADREVNWIDNIEKYFFEKWLTTKDWEGSVMDTIIFERPDETDETWRTYIKDTLGISYQTYDDYLEDKEYLIKFEYNKKGSITEIKFDNVDYSDEDPGFELYTVDPIFEEADRWKLWKGLVEYDIEDTMSEEEMIRYANEFAENNICDYLRNLWYEVDDTRYHYFLLWDENFIAEKDWKKTFIFVWCSVYPETPKLNPVRELRANPAMRMGECEFMFLWVQFSSKDPERKEAWVAIRRDQFDCKYTLEVIK